MQDSTPGYRFTAIGTFDRLLKGKMALNHSVNESGGGQGNPPWLPSLLSFELRGVAIAA